FTPNSGQCASNVVLNVAIQVINGTILGESTLCQGATSVMSSGITGGVWSSQDESVLSIDQNGVVTGIQTGTAIIEYSIQNSCTFVLTKNITVIALPNPQINNQFICVDPQTNVVLAPVVLDSGLNNATHSFAWNLNGQPLSTTDSFHLASQEGVYTVTAMNLATGCVGSSTATVEVSSTAIATSVVSGDFQQNQTVTITLIGGSGDYVYILNDGHQQDSPVFTSIPSGENIIIIRDLNGCDDLILKVNSLQYPLFFTPNGDNINDTWNINVLENQSDSRLYIFDRYGKLIKNLRPSLGEGWDGTFLGFPLPASDYWFVLQYRDQEGNKKKFNSHFSLKR
ncbi:MAG: T9SS type B sorting domain-containing protein, partial [Flavobacterium sp.]|nr:T9SS type B sorting domain-containing protein [Flavobacterium sp.]